MNDTPLSRDNCPPKPKDILWVERPKGGEKYRLTCYSSSIWGVWTHWTGHETKPCYQDHSLCHNGHEVETLRWRGYLQGWSQQRGKQCFMQLTPAAAWQLLEQLQPGQLLRGLTLDVWRTKSNKGRLHCAVVQYVTKNPNELPEEIDPRKSLYALWKVAPRSDMLHVALAKFQEDVPIDEKEPRVA